MLASLLQQHDVPQDAARFCITIGSHSTIPSDAPLSWRSETTLFSDPSGPALKPHCKKNATLAKRRLWQVQVKHCLSSPGPLRPVLV
eukprot:5328581-Amphidinium_carterae.2